MERNVGGIDRTARLVAGLLLALTGVLALLNVLPLGTPAGIGLALVGAVVFGTGATQQCLAYRLFGINTCSRT